MNEKQKQKKVYKHQVSRYFLALLGQITQQKKKKKNEE